MTTKLVTVPPGCAPDQARELLHKHRIEKMLVVDNGKLVGLITIKDLLQAERNPLALTTRSAYCLKTIRIQNISIYLADVVCDGCTLLI